MSEFSYIADQFNLIPWILSRLNYKNYLLDLGPLNLLKLCPAAINPVLHYIMLDPLLKLHFQVASSMQQFIQSLRTPIWIQNF